MKVAVLGGGMGGVTAAWKLAQAGHDVTIYQRGFRLGGKGASGRNARENQRIEEHGLHVLMGFYEQSFRLLKDVYAEAHKGTPGPFGAPLPFEQAFTRWDTCVFSRPRQGAWSFFPVEFPSKPNRPWDPPGPPPDFFDLFQKGLDVLNLIHREIQRLIPDATVDAAITDAIRTLRSIDQKVVTSAMRTALPALEGVLAPVIPLLFAAAKSEREEWLVIALCFLLGNALAMVRDDLIKTDPDFESVNGADYRDWIGSALDRIFVPDWASRRSPFVMALYDLAFSGPRTLAAGVTLKTVMLMGLDYRGDVAFKMNAGMGDVVFAPFALAFDRMNVKVEYFHRVTALGLDSAKRRIETITFERQVKTARDYDPLVAVNGIACWPHLPKAGLLDSKYGNDVGNGKFYDFEHANDPSPYAFDSDPYTLHRVSDFDVVVLAIPVGALAGICKHLMPHSARFHDMVLGLTTIRTVALQAWLHCGFADLGSPAPKGMVISYAAPFNSWADMTQVLAQEQWPASPAVKNIAYFCDALPENVPSDAAMAWAAAKAIAWLQTDVRHLWPGFQYPSQLAALYARANVAPHERYVLTEAGTTQLRLGAGKSGFVNLALAGDWVSTALNSGCLEAATLGGLAAAKAITSNEVHP